MSLAREFSQHKTKKNLIINGNFDIWQRGTSFSSFSGFVYTSDRWAGQAQGGTMTVSRQSFTLGQSDVPGNPNYFIRLNATGAAQYMGLYQRIEGVETGAGKTVTISAWMKSPDSSVTDMELVLSQYFGTGGSPSSEVFYVSSDFTPTSSWQKFTFTTTLGSVSGKTLGTNGDDFLDLRIQNDNNETFQLDIAQVQVEISPVATDFEIRPSTEELLLCQRYYCKTFSQGTTPQQASGTFDGSVTTAANNSGNGANNFVFPVEMRAVPTLTTYNPTQSLANWRNTGDTVNVNAIVNHISTRQGRLAFTGGVANTFYAIHSSADAEL